MNLHRFVTLVICCTHNRIPHTNVSIMRRRSPHLTQRPVRSGCQAGAHTGNQNTENTESTESKHRSQRRHTTGAVDIMAVALLLQTALLLCIGRRPLALTMRYWQSPFPRARVARVAPLHAPVLLSTRKPFLHTRVAVSSLTRPKRQPAAMPSHTGPKTYPACHLTRAVWRTFTLFTLERTCSSQRKLQGRARCAYMQLPA